MMAAMIQKILVKIGYRSPEILARKKGVFLAVAAL